jgi:hypothetical protein
MSNKVPPNEEEVPFTTGGDWSVGINSRTSLQQSEMLSLLGRGLQKLYDDLIDENVPHHLAQLVEQIQSRQQDGED